MGTGEAAKGKYSRLSPTFGICGRIKVTTQHCRSLGSSSTLLDFDSLSNWDKSSGLKGKIVPSGGAFLYLLAQIGSFNSLFHRKMKRHVQTIEPWGRKGHSRCFKGAKKEFSCSNVVY